MIRSMRDQMNPAAVAILGLMLGWMPLLVAAEEGQPSAGTSVVRVTATNQGYNFIRPWEKESPNRRDGLGAVVEGGRVLVTAEMVRDHTFIELEKPDTGEKTPAKVVGVDYEVNLALLETEDDPEFLSSFVPMKVDAGVRTGDTLEVWQIERNGTPAITEGTVIRVDVGGGGYFADGAFFLQYVLRGSLQYRAGSFTLPVAKDGKLAGLLVTYDSKQQTSDLIAAPIIDHFLRDLEDGEYSGFPNLGLAYSSTLDEQLRRYLKIDEYEGGVFVRRVSPKGSAANGGIQDGDVLLEIDGYAIDARGNYDHPEYGRLNFSHLVRGAPEVGQVMKVKLVRDGELLELEFPMIRKNPEDYLIDPYMFDRGPKFLILGGLIFQEVTLPYLKAWGDKWTTSAPFHLVHANAHQETLQEEGREKLVILSATILTPATLGYDKINNRVVTKVNGREIGSLKDLDAALQEPAEGIHKIEFDEFPEVIYVDDATAQAVNQQFPRLGIFELKRLD